MHIFLLPVYKQYIQGQNGINKWRSYDRKYHMSDSNLKADKQVHSNNFS